MLLPAGDPGIKEATGVAAAAAAPAPDSATAGVNSDVKLQAPKAVSTPPHRIAGVRRNAARDSMLAPRFRDENFLNGC